jgi:hypothetical protein
MQYSVVFSPRRWSNLSRYGLDAHEFLVCSQSSHGDSWQRFCLELNQHKFFDEQHAPAELEGVVLKPES